ncbi:sarcoplasmic reticulum histidine-rich calcium-binding protein-like [Amphibalanus amphitrite]|uniref:sarcoplasmic reticulum histidine-rich calcium-binding protein-like n=1 Tax=Amphibalanus amphitrite TaxID=1232801 RepID=UPI001C92AABC|nr:sarcoplasmic reticulum histidine-rich calcium-binding protein-like [Amphibalanus amphitrite]
MAAPLTSLVLILLMLTSTLGFLGHHKKVLAGDEEKGRIVSSHYWDKFRDFMDEVAAADFFVRTDMLTKPDSAEALAPSQLLDAIAARLDDSEWLDELDAEYQKYGEHNMTVLINTFRKLGRVAKKHKEKIPVDVLRQLMWRGVVRPERQHDLEKRLSAALQLFFDTDLALRLQRVAPDVFEEYLIGVFEFDWMPLEEILEDTLSHHELKTQLADEIGGTTEHDSVRPYSTHHRPPGAQNSKGRSPHPHETFHTEATPTVEGSGHADDHSVHNRVHEVQVETVHGDIPDGEWHGGGFVWHEEHDDFIEDVFVSDEDEGSGKGIIREAHPHKGRHRKPHKHPHDRPHHHRHQQPAEDDIEDNLIPVTTERSHGYEQSSEEELEDQAHVEGSAEGDASHGGSSSEEEHEQSKSDGSSHPGKHVGREDHPGRHRGREKGDRDSSKRGRGKHDEQHEEEEKSGQSADGKERNARKVSASLVSNEGPRRVDNKHVTGEHPGKKPNSGDEKQPVQEEDPPQDADDASGAEEEEGGAEWIQGVPPGTPDWSEGEGVGHKHPRSSSITDRVEDPNSCVTCQTMVTEKRCGRICDYICRMCKGVY